MPHRVDNTFSKACVNVLKKVNVNGTWKLCPIVRESNGRLKDRVRVRGRIEVHSEGVYYIEWREAGRRRREAIPNRAEVLERARLKSLELEARKSGVELDTVRSLEASKPRVSVLPTNVSPTVLSFSDQNGTAAQFLRKRGILAVWT